jgi:UDP-N-acetylglucosamine 2-epimerase (non-hydrolysing)
MKHRNKVAVLFGTRPEAIKLAPVILALRDDARFRCSVCVTAQHRQMLDQVIETFRIAPDVDLNVMRPGQSLADLTARAVRGLNQYLAQNKPDLVLVQGDTTTVFCAALAAFYQGIPVGHVEAGLRTGDLRAPWPEEANRVLTSRIAALHFTPTDLGRQNLLREGIPPARIFVTGNTVVDALRLAVARIRERPPRIKALPEDLQPGADANLHPLPRLILITGHRRENFGEGFRNICRAIAELAGMHPDVHFVYPVHLNPNVRSVVRKILKPGRQKNVHLIEPLDYLPFVALMNRAHLILTDSGGVQEEAPSLGKPVLVMRERTERPEGVAAGVVKLVGAKRDRIVSEVSHLLSDPAEYRRMARVCDLYGDGHAAGRILKVCRRFLSGS